ncbi:MAG: winged helix-turn-helix transcriptional regulator [Chloroflexi bacterium]|nr:winged helix-turn-helix transcriptional regulator [Chloroflexota bacterium]
MPEWTFFTNYGLVLAYIARNTQGTAREIASAINITERTTLKIIADLEAEGYIDRERVGRGNVYRIQSHMGLRHDTTRDVVVGDLLNVLSYPKGKTSSD